jgi:hypothetical protein
MDGAIQSVSLASDVEAAQAEPNAATIATRAEASARRNRFNKFERNVAAAAALFLIWKAACPCQK